MAAEQVVHAPAERAPEYDIDAAKPVAERLARLLDELAASRGVPVRPVKIGIGRFAGEDHDTVTVSQIIELAPEAAGAYILSVEDQIDAWIEALPPEDLRHFNGTIHTGMYWA